MSDDPVQFIAWAACACVAFAVFCGVIGELIALAISEFRNRRADG